jgi:hypothetical protein
MADTATPTTKTAELHSRALAPEEWEPALDGLASFLREAFPRSIVTAEYGFACDIHADLTYVTMRIGVHWLHEFLRESVERHIFLPGRSDMYVHAPDQQLSVTFCHEADIHVSSPHPALLQKLLSTQPFSHFAFPNT